MQILSSSLRPKLNPMNSTLNSFHSISMLDSLPKTFEDFVSKLGDSYPGASDKQYMSWLLKVRSRCSKVLDPVAKVEYSSIHHSTWETIYKPLRELHYEFGCKEHVKSLSELEKLGIFKRNEIPQFENINRFLKTKTGFKLVNVGGMINARTFLYGLAFGVFYSTQYIRHASVPFYSPEPDVVHELMGHVPLLANKNFASFTRKVGQMALDADDQLIDLIAKVYFYTVEFGVTQDKIVGAGILGSCKESERVARKGDFFEKWNLDKILAKELTLSKYQPAYFDIGSIENLEKIFEEFNERFD
jgi:phenylalanine-4-hydroxylase